MLKGKKILVGVTGGIAAYKAAILIRLLIRAGAEVKVLMTKYAKEFITPLTLATLSKNPILIDFFDPENGSWNSHVDLGLWADGYIIAPATANTMAKMANGISDNLLLTTYLSAKCPVFIAPAMDLDMFKHPATSKNINTLQSYGNVIIEPETGELASGLEGKGRMAEPETIFESVMNYFKKKSNFQSVLKSKKVLITAGPTFEKIDPVRFIGNHSSGKMGYALARSLADSGAAVTLVSGPVNQKKPENIDIIEVVSAAEMFEKCREIYTNFDIIVLAAAVADFTPVSVSDQKIKEKNENLVIQLKPTIDIAKYIGEHKAKNQFLAGFALETENELENAIQKLKRKNFDFIVLNSLQDQGAGFGHNTNKITIVDKNNKIDKFELKSKEDVASDIVEKIVSMHA